MDLNPIKSTIRPRPHRGFGREPRSKGGFASFVAPPSGGRSRTGRSQSRAIIIKKELKFGKNKEDEFAKKINCYFSDLKQSSYQFSCYDFTAKNLLIELKSRRIKKNQYLTTIITEHKIKKLLSLKRDKQKLRIIIVFNFTDEMTLIDIDDVIKYGEIKKFQRNDSNFPISHYYIPIEFLKNFKEEIKTYI